MHLSTLLLLAVSGSALADSGGAFGPFQGSCKHGCAVFCWGGNIMCRVNGPATTISWPWYGACRGAQLCEAYGLCGPQCLDPPGSLSVSLAALSRVQTVQFVKGCR
jgi:hypothetical protein